MKRTTLLLVVAILACTFAVSQAFARPAPPEDPGAVRVQLEATANAPEGASGFAVITENATGHYAVTIHVNGLDGGQWVAWGVGTGTRVDEFQCNTRGIGQDQAIVETIGDVVNVKAIDGAGGDGSIVLTGEIE